MQEQSRTEQCPVLPTIVITTGSIEALKWIALLSMTIDHANRFFFNATIYSAYCAGRLALPLFAFVLAYNLAKPTSLTDGLYTRVFFRLIIFGILATPGYIAMRHLQNLYPLNIMFSFATSVTAFYFYDANSSANKAISLLIILLGGFFVEYDWAGILFCVSCWSYCRKPSILALLACGLAYLLLELLNQNSWALMSIPLIFFAAKFDLKIPRIPYLFYIYYPLHLSTLYGLKQISI